MSLWGWRTSSTDRRIFVGPRGPPGASMTWKGDWDPTETYSTLNAVKYSGSSWIASEVSTNKIPSSGSAYWDMLAEGIASSGLTADRLLMTDSGSNIVTGDLSAYLLCSSGLSISTSSGASTISTNFISSDSTINIVSSSGALDFSTPEISTFNVSSGKFTQRILFLVR